MSHRFAAGHRRVVHPALTWTRRAGTEIVRIGFWSEYVGPIVQIARVYGIALAKCEWCTCYGFRLDVTPHIKDTEAHHLAVCCFFPAEPRREALDDSGLVFLKWLMLGEPVGEVVMHGPGSRLRLSWAVKCIHSLLPNCMLLFVFKRPLEARH